MTTASIHVLVVDDDASARQHMRALLGAHDDVMVEECSDGREAVRALTSSVVDLVLLDIEMPRLDGFGVLAEVGAGRMPPVIFVSAYSAYAVRAFEAYALDYLLKPFDDARFATALDRGRTQVHARRHANAALDQRLIGILEHLQRPQPAAYPDALAIRSGGQYAVVRVADVDWIEADGNYARLYVRGRARLLTRTLAALESELLDPNVFIRVHRSAIVNASKIASVEPLFHGELTLILHDGTRVPCSRRHRKRLEERLYFTT